MVGRHHVGRMAARLALVTALGPLGVTVARADLFTSYSNMEVFELPAGTSVFDVAPDGRIVALVGADVYREDGPGVRQFSLVGTLSAADIPSLGAAFIAVSAGGSRIAVGNNGGVSFSDFRVGVFDADTLAGDWVASEHFLAVWLDDARILIAAGDFAAGSFVTLLDTTDPDPGNWTNSTIVADVGGASGGVALDAAGNLFTANGFSTLGPSGTGAIKAFASADWTAALSTGVPLNFEDQGTWVADVLSGSPLVFDVEGNLLVGGGDVAPDNDAVAIVRASAVAAALAGMGPADAEDPLSVRRVDPIPDNDFNFYHCTANVALGEFYVRDFGSQTVFVFRDPAGIPAVGEWGLVCMSLGLLGAGSVVWRRQGLQPVAVRR